MSATTIATHTDELVDWLTAHGFRDFGGAYNAGNITVTVYPRLTHPTIVSLRNRWFVKFAPFTPFPVVVAAVKAAMAEPGSA